jgi:hypothetical protein
MSNELETFTEALKGLVAEARKPNDFQWNGGDFLKAIETALLLEAAQIHANRRVKESHTHKFLLHPNDFLLSFPDYAKKQMATLLKAGAEKV